MCGYLSQINFIILPLLEVLLTFNFSKLHFVNMYYSSQFHKFSVFIPVIKYTRKVYFLPRFVWENARNLCIFEAFSFHRIVLGTLTTKR